MRPHYKKIGVILLWFIYYLILNGCSVGRMAGLDYWELNSEVELDVYPLEANKSTSGNGRNNHIDQVRQRHRLCFLKDE